MANGCWIQATDCFDTEGTVEEDFVWEGLDTLLLMAYRGRLSGHGGLQPAQLRHEQPPPRGVTGDPARVPKAMAEIEAEVSGWVTPDRA
jgi:hypothetical protein